MEFIEDIVADNFLQVDQRGALCIFIEKDDPSLLSTLLGLQAEGFLMCKYPSMTNDSCLACKLKDGNDTLIPYLGAEEFIEETHFIWYYDRKTPQEQGKNWTFNFDGVEHGHDWGAVGGETIPVPAWVQKIDGLPSSITMNRGIPDFRESQVDKGLAKLGGSVRIQNQFRLKDLEPETDDAYNNESIRFDLDENGQPKVFVFRGGVAQYGSAHVTGAPYTGTLNPSFSQRARLGSVWPGGYFWEDYYDNRKTKAPDWYTCEFYDTYGLDDVFESLVYTITCWRYMDRRLGTWRYVCIDVSPVLEHFSNKNRLHSSTAKLKFNKLQLNSVAPAEDLDMDPLAYLKEQEEA